MKRNIRKRRFTPKRNRFIKYYHNIFKMGSNIRPKSYETFLNPEQSFNILFCSIIVEKNEFVSGIFGFNYNNNDGNDKNIYTYDILWKKESIIDNIMNSVINQIFTFRSLHSSLESLPIIFIVENNVGDLSTILHEALLCHKPFLCNWYIYTEKNIYGFSPLRLGLNLNSIRYWCGKNFLEMILKTDHLKFHEQMNFQTVYQIKKELYNLSAKFDPRKATHFIPTLYGKGKTSIKIVECMILFLLSANAFTTNHSIQFFTFNGCGKRCLDCKHYSTGHLESL